MTLPVMFIHRKSSSSSSFSSTTIVISMHLSLIMHLPEFHFKNMATFVVLVLTFRVHAS